MNRLTLTGNLTRDPVLRYTADGKAVCNLRVAENGRTNGEAMFLDLASFGPQAEACAKYLVKGRLIGFDGRLDNRPWITADGAKRDHFSGIGRVEFLGAPPTAHTPGADDEPAADEIALAATLADEDVETPVG